MTGSARFAFQHHALPNDLRWILRDELVFHDASRSPNKNLARSAEAYYKEEWLFYTSPFAKGKRLGAHVGAHAAPDRLQAFRTATLVQNEVLLNNILRDTHAKIEALPEDWESILCDTCKCVAGRIKLSHSPGMRDNPSWPMSVSDFFKAHGPRDCQVEDPKLRQ